MELPDEGKASFHFEAHAPDNVEKNVPALQRNSIGDAIGNNLRPASHSHALACLEWNASCRHRLRVRGCASRLISFNDTG